ncbi:beta-lactamase family protein [Natronosporangium hydrolyticum]|uniref:Beta-lactamase family protein n=1 Tax=Natronosporangium hydrolyticum TaxID=2811111 RepID=A0A895Y7G6_9ACTN|nr:serine hydrolase domain-containing protein [Natronosporangium hydrolyticum]QSB13301.1 beta-lactamase family protein [Natronosporangium hydrolyticum]
MTHVNVVAPRRRPRRAAAKLAATAAATAFALAGAGCAGAAGAAGEAATVPPVAAPQPGVLTAADVESWLDGLLPAALNRAGIAGATVAVVHDGDVLTTRGYGYADTGHGGAEPVEVDGEQTLFRIGSVSKVVTAAAAMQLVEAGQLDLDADIDHNLDFDLPRRYDADITMRHLLAHTAGFEEQLAGIIGTGDEPVDLRAAVVNDPPEQIYEPGTTPAYSNYGYALAGYLVERVSGMPFDDYLDRHVFEPLEMTSSTFRQPLPDPLRQRMSHGYRTASDPPEEFERVGVPPAGSLTTSAADMARYMLAQLGEEPFGPALLDDGTRDLMFTPAFGEDTLGALADAPRMSLGLFDESRNGQRILGHGGDTRHFHSHMQLYPDEGAGVFVSLNSTGEVPYDTLALRETLLEGFTDRYFPATTPPAGTVAEATMRENADLIAGSYVSSRNFHSTFLSVYALADQTRVTALDDGRLLFEPGPQSYQPAVYEQVSESVWREVHGDQTIAVRTADGEVTAIGHDSALALLPAGPAHRLGLPVLIGSVVVLVVGLVAWPVGAVLRRRRGRPLPAAPARILRRLALVGAACAVVALGGWATVLAAVIDFQAVPPAGLRFLQALQLLGVAGLVPAAMWLAGAVRHRAGWRPIAAGGLLLLALSGVAWFALAFQLLAPSISY